MKKLGLAIILLSSGMVISHTQAQTSDGGALDGYSSDQGSTTSVDQSASATIVPNTPSDNSFTYSQGGTKPPLQVTISQPDYFLHNVPPAESYVDYTGKIVDTAKSSGPFNIMWNSNNGPAIAQFTNPNPTKAPYKTRVFFNAGGAYRIKLRVNDGTYSDVDKTNVFVPRQIGSGGDVFVNSYTGLQKLSDISIPISENQNVGVRLVNRIKSPYSGQYVHIFINGTRYFSSLIRGQINQDVESIRAKNLRLWRSAC